MDFLSSLNPLEAELLKRVMTQDVVADVTSVTYI